MTETRSSILRIDRVERTIEYAACEELQRRAFGYHDIDIVPKNELVAVHRSGGLVLGAFDEAAGTGPLARLAGFVFGFVGRHHATGAVYHSSRMVAVDPAYRRRGVASTLKLAQREAVLEQGLAEVRWTFDPYAAANATLNLRKLGAVAYGFVRDYYGPTTSPLHARGPTDRLLVRWELSAPRLSRPAVHRIEVRPQTPHAEVRAAFEAAFAEGLEAVDFDPETPAYLLARRSGASTSTSSSTSTSTSSSTSPSTR